MEKVLEKQKAECITFENLFGDIYATEANWFYWYEYICRISKDTIDNIIQIC